MVGAFVFADGDVDHGQNAERISVAARLTCSAATWEQFSRAAAMVCFEGEMNEDKFACPEQPGPMREGVPSGTPSQLKRTYGPQV